MKKIKNTTISLIIFNLIPLFGVLFFSWSILFVIYIYWLENLVIGFFTILKIWNAKIIAKDNSIVKENEKIFAIIFFIIHFGGFNFLYGTFFSIDAINFFNGGKDFNKFTVLYCLIALFFSHGISYYKNYIKKEEYNKFDFNEVIFLAYKRIIIIHLVLILGTGLSSFFKFPFLIVALLVVLKIVVDAYLHEKEHKDNKIIIKN